MKRKENKVKDDEGSPINSLKGTEETSNALILMVMAFVHNFFPTPPSFCTSNLRDLRYLTASSRTATLFI